MTYAVGIDVGTTYSAAAVWQAGRARTVPLGDRAHTVPSVLFLREDGEMLAGEPAVRRAVADPARVARDVKRRVGDSVPVVLGDRSYAAEQLTAEMVRWVVDRVAEREGAAPEYAVLTHPAGWGEYRRTLLADAAARAGLREAGLVPEPVAAALYYAVGDHLPAGAVVAVYDLGGGTFDATVVRKTATGVEIVGVPDGDDRCGGLDIDELVLGMVRNALGDAWPTDADDPLTLRALAQVRTAVTEAKEALSSDTAAVVPVVLPGVVREVRVTRGELEEAVRPTVDHTVAVLRRACTAAAVDPRDLHSVLLVGGSSRIPLVAQTVTRALGRPVAVDAHPKFAVCLGAAVAGAARLPAAATATAMAGPPPAVFAAAARAPGGAGAADLLPAAAPVAVDADLEVAGLTAPADLRLPRPGRPRDPVAAAPQHAPLVVRVGRPTGGGPSTTVPGRLPRAALLVAAGAGLAAGLAAVLVLR